LWTGGKNLYGQLGTGKNVDSLEMKRNYFFCGMKVARAFAGGYSTFVEIGNNFI
jgi:hypothetical protein